MNAKIKHLIIEKLSLGLSVAQIVKDLNCARSVVYYHKAEMKKRSDEFRTVPANVLNLGKPQEEVCPKCPTLSPIEDSTPISQTLTQYSGTPIFRKFREFNETQPPEQQVSYEILAQNGLLKCILTGETMNPFGNSNGFTLMEERGFVFFVKNEFAEMVKKEVLKEVQKKFVTN